MTVVRYVLLAAVVIFGAWRVWQRAHGRRSVTGPVLEKAKNRAAVGLSRRLLPEWSGRVGPVGLVAEREIRERVRSRVFRIGTFIVLLAIAAAVVIPVIHKNKHEPQKIGVVGVLSPQIRQTVLGEGTSVGTGVTLVDEPDLPSARAALASGQIEMVIVDAERLLVKKAVSPTDTSSGALLVRLVAASVALQHGLEATGASPADAARLAHPPPLPVSSLEPAAPKKSRGTEKTTAVYGLILVYVLLTQYGTWIMLGVVEEKSSRVVEVLLSAVRPGQLLIGKVAGIGAVALTQAALIVAVALGLAAAVGSNLVHGAAPTEVISILVWLLLGYAFYCWVYAAGGSLADRQEHVQTLAFPLQIPILFGYLASLTSLGSTTPSTFVHVLAFIPFTAPFAMNVLVADGAATWWQFVLSAGVTAAATVVLARVATTVYVRAVLRTGRRVKLKEVLRPA